MDNISRFPFQTFEPLNAHGFTTEGDTLHVKVEFIRYMAAGVPEGSHVTSTDYDCVIKVDDVHYYSNSNGLWRDGETPPAENLPGTDRHAFDVDKPVQDRLTEKDISSLKVGDKLIHPATGRLITVISTKEAPKKIRLMDEGDNTYYNAVHESLTYYGWRLTEDSVDLKGHS